MLRQWAEPPMPSLTSVSSAPRANFEGRRQMPQFNLSEEELEDLVNFFEWTSRIDTQGWPPNDAG